MGKQIKPTQRHGLFPLYEPRESNYGAEIDVIALHGLGGDAFRTWSDSQGHLWLRDSLPNYLPSARILTYGYDSAVVFSNSRMTLDNFSLALLTDLQSIRQHKTERKRPILFVCHSLGGLLFKQALVTAALDGDRFKYISQSIRGAVFMGTPHRGSNSAGTGEFFAKLINIPTFGRGIRSDLISLLKPSSHILEQLTRQSVHVLAPLSILTLHEMKPIGPSLIVEPFSAVMGLPNEEVYAINQDHREIARVSPLDGYYHSRIQELVRELAKKCMAKGMEASCEYLLDKLYCTNFNELLLRPRKPHPGSSEWLMRHEKYLHWSRDDGPPMLLLAGPPGSGKSVMSRFLVEEANNGSSSMTQFHGSLVIHYFCSARSAEEITTEEILRSLLYQLLQLRPEAHRLVRNRLEKRTFYDELVVDMTSQRLWLALQDVLSMKSANRCLIVIDALDELDSDVSFDIFHTFTKIVNIFKKDKPEQLIKVFMSGRMVNNKFKKSKLNNVIYMDASLTGPGLADFVRHSVQNFAVENLGFAESASQQTRNQIIQKITDGADGMFLWAVMALEAFRKGALWNEDVVQRKIRQLNSSPVGIVALFEDMLSRVDKDLEQDMWLIFSIIATMRRPLLERELSILLALLTSDRSVQRSTEIRAFRDLGQLVQSFPEFITRGDNGSFNFVHLSLGQYLRSDWARNKPGLLTTMHQRIAEACLGYLRLEDLLQTIRSTTSMTDVFVDFPFLEYAGKHYLAHISYVDETHDVWLSYARMAHSNSIFAMPLFTKCSIFDLQYVSPLNTVVSLLGSHDLVHRFIQIGYDLDDKWKKGLGEPTALQLCASRMRDPNMRSIAALLLRLGADPNDPDGAVHETVLQSAIRNHNWELYEQLIQSLRIDLDRKNGMGRTALHTIMEYADLAILDGYLNRGGFNINAQDREGYTALHVATQKRMFKMVERLLQADTINLGVADQYGRTPLALATYWGDEKAARVLIGHSSAAPVPEPDQLSPLICALAHSDRGLTDMLINHCGYRGLKSHVDLSGKGVLHRAVMNDWPDMVDKCIRESNDASLVDHIDHSGSTALHYAAAMGHVQCVKVLKRHGASSTIQDRNGRTAPQAALDSGFKDTIIALLDYNDVDPNQRDHQGRNLVHWAASIDCLDVMDKIAKLPDVDICRKDNMSLLPVDIAYRCSCATVGRYLSLLMRLRFPQFAEWASSYDWEAMYTSPEITSIEEYWVIEDRDKELLDRESRRNRINHKEWKAVRKQYPEYLWGLVNVSCNAKGESQNRDRRS